MKKLDERLSNALQSGIEPPQSLNCQILEQAKEYTMKQSKFKHTAAAVAAVCIIGAGGVSAFAAYHFLNPSQVAQELTEAPALSQAFESKDAVVVNETQSTAGYNVTLLGLVSGSDLSPYVDENTSVSAAKTYVVVAIEKEDGTPMPDTTDADYQTFCVSPLIHGQDWMTANAATLNVLNAAFTQDGIQYELLECDNMEIFSDIGVQLGIVRSFGQEASAFQLDRDTGSYERNPGYNDINALFTLPLDKSKADEAAAQAYLDQIQDKTSDADNDSEDSIDYASDFSDPELGKWVSSAMEGDRTFLEENASAVEASREVLTPDADQNISWGSAEESHGAMNVADWPYPVGEIHAFAVGSDDTFEGTNISTLTLNEDGTFTYLEYTPDVK